MRSLRGVFRLRSKVKPCIQIDLRMAMSSRVRRHIVTVFSNSMHGIYRTLSDACRTFRVLLGFRIFQLRTHWGAFAMLNRQQKGRCGTALHTWTNRPSWIACCIEFPQRVTDFRVLLPTLNRSQQQRKSQPSS